MHDTNQWKKAKQAETLPQASKRFEGWTSQDLAFVEAFADANAAELALALGRTVYAIETIRQRLADGTATTSTRRRRTEYRGWLEGMGDGDE